MSNYVYDKVVCIDNRYLTTNLTIGKVYEVWDYKIIRGVKYIRILNDRLSSGSYNEKRFKDMITIRNETIDNVLG